MAARVIAFVGLVGLLAWAGGMVVPPLSRRPASPAEFDNAKAVAHVEAIARLPHPAGSAENERVRGYLLDELHELGMEPRVLEGRAYSKKLDREVTVRNVLARLRGTEGGPGVMLAAHYDSVPFGPGAGDDAAAVGAIVEACRALKTGGGLRRDVWVLLTDGEELGLVGALALFRDEARLLREAIAEPAKEIGVVVNFEGRGTAGPSLMFETGPGNREVVRHFAKADPYPYANSLSYDVYRMLPNDTDFTVFRRGGLQGLNFAFIGNYFWYHTRFDTPERLSPSSVFHHGVHAVAMGRHFASLSAEELRAVRGEGRGNAVYFNVSRSVLVWYPGWWAWPLTVGQIVLGVGAVVVAVRRGVVTRWGVVGAVGRLVVAMVLTPAAVYGLMIIMPQVRSPGAFAWQVAGVVGLAAVITVMVAVTPVRFWRRDEQGAWGRRVASFAAVMIGMLGGLGVAANIYVPGGSYLVAWTGLLLAVGMFVAGWRRAGAVAGGGATTQASHEDGVAKQDDTIGEWASALLVVVVWAPVVVLWGPMIVQLFTALTLRMAWGCSVVVVLAVGMLVAGFTPLAIGASGRGGRPGAMPGDPA